MNWNLIHSSEQLEQIVRLSHDQPQVIFKHSTRCSISSVVKNRLEKETLPDQSFHFLDLIAHRTVSNTIAQQFGVIHESPQILVIKEGKCIFHESHMAIHFQDLLPYLNKN